MEKLNLYQQPIWECESTGKTNLTYEQALESEKSEYANVAYKFSSTTRKVILNRVQFRKSHDKKYIRHLTYNYCY